MTLIEDYLERSPQETKRIIGIDFEQFQELVKQAEIIQTRKQQERPRLIQAGGGRSRKLSVKQEVLLTLVYLSQFPTFQMLGIQFRVSESTAHNIFHYWINILSELLPASLMEQFKKKDSEWEWIEEILTDLDLIVDSYQQPIERPRDPKEQSKYYSKYKAGHTFKNQLIITPNGREIVDGVVGKPGPTSDKRFVALPTGSIFGKSRFSRRYSLYRRTQNIYPSKKTEIRKINPRTERRKSTEISKKNSS